MCRLRNKDASELSFSADELLGIHRCYKFEESGVRQRCTAMWKFGTGLSDSELWGFAA
jgi:hypothetical protein